MEVVIVFETLGTELPDTHEPDPLEALGLPVIKVGIWDLRKLGDGLAIALAKEVEVWPGCDFQKPLWLLAQSLRCRES